MDIILESNFIKLSTPRIFKALLKLYARAVKLNSAFTFSISLVNTSIAGVIILTVSFHFPVYIPFLSPLFLISFLFYSSLCLLYMAFYYANSTTLCLNYLLELGNIKIFVLRGRLLSFGVSLSSKGYSLT